MNGVFQWMVDHVREHQENIWNNWIKLFTSCFALHTIALCCWQNIRIIVAWLAHWHWRAFYHYTNYICLWSSMVIQYDLKIRPTHKLYTVLHSNCLKWHTLTHAHRLRSNATSSCVHANKNERVNGNETQVTNAGEKERRIACWCNRNRNTACEC